VATGVVGLSLDDAYRLTPAEFNEAYRAWHEMHEAAYRTSWEQTRFIAHCSLAPHSKKRLKPTDLVLFDWERERGGEKEKTSPGVCTREDFERIAKKYETGTTSSKKT
jgi:hypothetical protein